MRETGHWDDTLVIFISDHDMPFPGSKDSAYEPGLRCPCVVRSPRVKRQGVVSDAMISWVDITPTILDFAGMTAGKKLHGRSMLPVLGHEHVDGWDRIYASHTFHEVTMYYPTRVLRERKYKLVWNIAHGLEYLTPATQPMEGMRFLLYSATPFRRIPRCARSYRLTIPPHPRP